MSNIRKKQLVLMVSLVFVAFISSTVATTFPQDFDYSLYSDIIVDAGYLWQINSSFHPYSCQPPDSVQINYSNLDAFYWMYHYLNDYATRSVKLQDKAIDGLSVIIIPGLGIAKQTGAASNYNNFAAQPFVWADLRVHDHWYARLYIRATNEIGSLSHYSGVRRSTCLSFPMLCYFWFLRHCEFHRYII